MSIPNFTFGTSINTRGTGKFKQKRDVIGFRMRCNIRRIFTFAFVAFGATLVLLSLPRDNFGREWDEAPRSSESQFLAANRRDSGLRPAMVGPQMSFQKQPNPPSLIRKEIEEDPFGQKSVPTRDSWERFYAQIGTCGVYSDDKTVDDLLTDLNRATIKAVHIMDGGTQAKLVFTFENDKQAVFKPMRFGRDYESDPNHFYFSDFERHNAEIATFHLDRVLGFRRAVPTVGRIVNITSELYDKAEKKLKKTFFISPAKNRCFVSRCDYYCDTTHAICGLPDLKEGSVQVFLPDEGVVPRRHNRSPYRRTYSKKNQIAEWQSDMNYCTDKVKVKKQYAHGRKLLDLVDLHILDYLIGNQDRHHYESFAVFENLPSYAIHLDNGRAFGRTDIDDDDIILPLRQCCVIRPSTLNTLLQFYSQPQALTKTLHASLIKDPVAPILAYKHYVAIERRLGKLMEFILECFKQKPVERILITEFHNANVPEANVEEEERSEEETGDKKEDKQK
ncbi:hypothetical protein NECAME_05782 [Necator americanus]|uniref:FAM20 C-terminal domain-containing protein n=1 Tax=Necator americanus TaxID=51031 RepID=W2U0Q4_NECAM|nr:hypothetical protein NECAME_05782 [Necator americanus]ETN86936.1 hypothetical protein NECAME_05782 [Necator americanus]